MAETKHRPRPAKKPLAAEGNGIIGDVLTLAETAAYLRVTEEEVLQATREQGLVGRLLGKEWRFLRASVDDWLRCATGGSVTRDFWQTQSGALRDDPHLDQIVQRAYRARRTGPGAD
jgi:excisionase family DNA binding protein